jgi:hypothetical protein
MHLRVTQSKRRRGITTMQFVVVAALITVSILAAARTLGTRTSTDLNTTAGQIGNPASLVNRFGGS